MFASCSSVRVDVQPAGVTAQFSSAVSGRGRIVGCCSWLDPFPPLTPPPLSRRCSPASPVLRVHPTSCSSLSLTLWACETGSFLLKGPSRISQVPYVEFLCMHRVSDPGRHCGELAIDAHAVIGFCFRQQHHRLLTIDNVAQYLAYRYPY